MSVLVLGVLSYPSALPNLDQDLTAFDFKQQLGNVAFADDEEEEEENGEEENGEEENGEEENGEEENGEEENGEEENGEEENGEEENGEEEEEEQEIELEGTITEILSSTSFKLSLENGTIITIFTNVDTEFDDFDSLDSIMGFGVEVEIVLSNSSLVATEIEIEEEEEEFEEDEIEIEGIVASIDSVTQSFTLESGEEIFVNDETEFDDFDSLDSILGFGVKVEVVLSNSSLVATEIEIEEEEDEKMSYTTMKENEEEAMQTALDLIYELQQRIEQLEDRIQTLLEKYESGEYFGTVPEVDSEIKSYTITFVGSATSIDDESIVDAEGQIFMENLLTIDDNISKFRVTGGEISIDNTFYDIVFGKARVSSSGSSGEKDIVVLLGQVIDFADEDDDSSTLKLVINSETSLEGDFGLDPISIEILPQSKIAGQWYLSGSGQLSLLEG